MSSNGFPNPKKVYGTWYIYDISKIPAKYLDIEKKRLPREHMLVTELFNTESLNVRMFFYNCKNILDGINKVLVKIKYPFNIFGQDSDNVVYKAHKFLLCLYWVNLENKYDFWKRADEVIRDLYGDCEDSSTLMHTYFLLNNIDSFWVVGQVFYKNNLLGGHCWIVAMLNGSYRIVETTLDKPIPSLDYLPTVDISKNVWKVMNITYKALAMIHNKSELWLEKSIVDFKKHEQYENFVNFVDEYCLLKRKLTSRQRKVVISEFKKFMISCL